jgi:putative redox protein
MPTQKAVVLEHRGGMIFESRPSSGHDYTFDDRESNTGGSPVETILSALGSCSAMDVVSIANKQRQSIDAYRVDVRGTQRDEYPQVYTEITVTHEVVGRDLSEVGIRRCIELSATKYCPVNAMISAGATVVHHRYHIVSTGTNPYDSEGDVVTTGPYARPDILADQT